MSPESCFALVVLTLYTLAALLPISVSSRTMVSLKGKRLPFVSLESLLTHPSEIKSLTNSSSMTFMKRLSKRSNTTNSPIKSRTKPLKKSRTKSLKKSRTQSLKKFRTQSLKKTPTKPLNKSRTATGPPQFVPGSFLESASPANLSFCRFRMGLPGAASLPPHPPASPELGASGPFRVLYNAVQAAPAPVDPLAVTLCTHATVDKLFTLAEQALRWDGPLSVALFAPRGDAALGVALLRRLCACLPQMERVSAHLVFPARHPPDLSARALAAAEGALGAGAGCAPPPVDLSARTFRRRAYLPYPVNACRNAARAAAHTRHVLVVDIELLPSGRMAHALRPVLAAADAADAIGPFPDVDSLAYIPACSLPRGPRVFTLPIFEVAAGVWPVPSTKKDLLRLIRSKTAFPFHNLIAPTCHRFPGLKRWLRADASIIAPYVVASRNGPYIHWEPIFVGTTEDPLYNEVLTWEGRQDKMAQAMEMCLRGYSFVVLDGAFLVHTPGIKRMEPRGVARRVFEFLKANSKAYKQILEHLKLRYPKRFAICTNQSAIGSNLHRQ